MTTLSHCDKEPRSQRAAAPAYPRALAAPLALVLATAVPPAVAAPAADAALASGRCARVAQRSQRLNLGSGVYTERAVAAAPLTIDLPVGVDAERYADCLRREGFDERTATAAYLERDAGCRASHTAPVRLGPAGDAPRIGGELDEAAYRSCMAGEIEVEVTLPE